MKKAKAALAVCTVIMTAVTVCVIAHFINIRTMDIAGSAVLAVNTLAYSFAYSEYLNKVSEYYY